MYVAILEDDERRRHRMEELLPTALPGYATVFFDNAPCMVEWLRKHLREVALLCLDHDLEWLDAVWVDAIREQVRVDSR